jgi:large-conductance mechanosensitive channel
MIQEIITFMIIGAAIALTISKAINKFRGKRKPAKKVDFKKQSFSMHHDCSDCSAECMIRDTVKPIIKENIDLCIKTEKRSNLK